MRKIKSKPKEKIFYTISPGDRGYQIDAWNSENFSEKATVKGFRGKNISQSKVEEVLSGLFIGNFEFNKVR